MLSSRDRVNPLAAALSLVLFPFLRRLSFAGPFHASDFCSPQATVEEP
jgi:hypothetical protein